MDEKTLASILDADGIEELVSKRAMEEFKLNPGEEYAELWYAQLDMLLQDLFRDEIVAVMARRIVLHAIATA